MISRAAAALIALIGWAGLAVQFNASHAHAGSVPATLWVLCRYFTIITNLALALAMSRIALGKRVSPFMLGGLTIAILLVGIVYSVLLQNLYHLRGAALIADTLLHKAAPIGAALYWLLLAPHGRLKWTAPWGWSLYPLLYFVYALSRGAIEHHYPYPFMDVGRIGVAQTALNALAIAAAFIVAGFALVWLDRRRLLGSRRTTG